MSLARIPSTAAVVWSIWVNITPPHKQEAPTESRNYSGATRERWFKSTFSWTVPTVKLSAAAYGIAETLAIVASRSPESSLSKTASALLVSTDSADNIRLSAVSTLAAGIAVLGAIIRRQCYAELGRLFTYELTIREKHRLVTSGPYAYVRHPSYTAFSMVILGTIMYVLSEGSYIRECGVWQASIGKALVLAWSGWMSMYVAMLVMRVELEDEVMRAEFKAEWEGWRDNVPWRLVPFIY